MKTVFKPAIFFASTILFSSMAISQVSNISNDNLVQYGKDDAYWVADVTCSGDSKRVIQRKTDGNEWCGKAVDGFCDGTKESLAVKICGAEYTSALSLINAAKQAQLNASRAEERTKRAETERANQRRLADERIKQQRLERAEQEAAAAPLKKQINIEEELLKIEEEKLNLRRQELDLQRRAVEIEALLEQAG
jgi:hypothetical protein